MPTEPNAVGVVLATRQEITAANGFSPTPASIDAGIATAVPNPAIPSIKFPKPHPIISIKTLLSIETPASIFFIESIAPVRKIKLYVNKAAIITRQIGHSALSIPSNTPVTVQATLSFHKNIAKTIVRISAIVQAL